MRSNASAQNRRPSIRGAFTLVELLVVVGIIALLITIIAPTLTRAREAAYSAQCRSNLSQLYKFMQQGDSESSIKLPVPPLWRGRVVGAGGEKALYCPKDKVAVAGAEDLSKLYFVQNGSTFSYFTDLLDGSSNDGQLRFQQSSSTQFVVTYMAGNFECAKFVITLGDPTKIEVPDHLSHEEDTGGCASHHYCCYDADGDGTADWSSDDMVIEGKGDDDDGPCGKPGVAYISVAGTTSYAMNADVIPLAPDPRQILFLDYEAAIADAFGTIRPVPDNWDDRLEPATKRHLGRVNVITAAGNVLSEGMSRAELEAEKALDEDGIWKFRRP